MLDFAIMTLMDEIRDGRTDLVSEYLAAGHSADSADKDGVTLMQWCAYYGDGSALKGLMAAGAKLDSLGEDLGLNAACFHGHWRLTKFLIERGAEVNRPLDDTGETPLHAALCTTNRLARNLVMKVLLARGANPNCATKPNVETSGFMRDARTKARRRCIAPQHSAMRRAFNCYSTPALRLTQKI
jgi:ankyrin repeat protein